MCFHDQERKMFSSHFLSLLSWPNRTCGQFGFAGVHFGPPKSTNQIPALFVQVLKVFKLDVRADLCIVRNSCVYDRREQWKSVRGKGINYLCSLFVSTIGSVNIGKRKGNLRKKFQENRTSCIWKYIYLSMQRLLC